MTFSLCYTISRHVNVAKSLDSLSELILYLIRVLCDVPLQIVDQLVRYVCLQFTLLHILAAWSDKGSAEGATMKQICPRVSNTHIFAPTK